VELTRRNIPLVKSGGLKFLDAAHIKDVPGSLRFPTNPLSSAATGLCLRTVAGTNDHAMTVD
jgi:ATP-dependent DNA helicase UvrD/PcrA